ncbi:MAG: AAA family ATPase [Deltaproteobacteria bacterium]|nr:AAA family ATPase [Deltaproteobacteria bacterium]
MPLPPAQFPPAPGPDDFRMLRERGHHYVDKTRLIVEWLRSPDQVILLPRPRRFGKTLNLSMMRAFLARGESDATALFEGLEVQSAGPEILSHQGRYPVIFVSLKDTKAGSYADFVAAMRSVIRLLVAEHRALLESPAVEPSQRARLARLLAGEADEETLRMSLRDLSVGLRDHHGEPTVILIDEYDAPIEAAFVSQGYDEVILFMQGMLGAALKSNPSLYRGVLTGVRRVAKETLFSDLNNVRTCTLLDPEYATAFGFTEDEVRAVLAAAGRLDALPDVRRWFNGYIFGGQNLYNPWSVLSFAQQGVLKDYWVATSSDALLRRVLLRSDGLEGDFELLLSGGSVEKRIDPQVALRDLDHEPGGVWSLLLTAGYLRADDVRYEHGEAVVSLAIPNVEVNNVWRRSFLSWLQRSGGGEASVKRLHQALLSGQTQDLARLLAKLVQNALSYHDTGLGPDSAPERVYQAFTLGLLVSLEPDWRVRSNRESGLGRADVLILPSAPGRPGVVLEFKRVWVEEGETPDQALNDAQRQITERRYAAELWAAGSSVVYAVAIAFEGKRVWARGEQVSPPA